MRTLKRLFATVLAMSILLPCAAWSKHSKRPDYRYKVPKLKYKKPKIKGHKLHH